MMNQVYNLVPILRHRGSLEVVANQSEGYGTRNDGESVANVPRRDSGANCINSMVQKVFPLSSIVFYVKHTAFLPSFSYALLHLTVLSFSGRMIAFLLAMGYSPLAIGVARTVSTVAELSATWISSRITRHFGSVTSGSISIAWETIWLSFGVGCYMIGGRLALAGLVAGVILSRIGLWGFDLAVQDIIQRVSFAFIHSLCFES